MWTNVHRHLLTCCDLDVEVKYELRKAEYQVKKYEFAGLPSGQYDGVDGVAISW